MGLESQYQKEFLAVELRHITSINVSGPPSPVTKGLFVGYFYN